MASHLAESSSSTQIAPKDAMQDTNEHNDDKSLTASRFSAAAVRAAGATLGGIAIGGALGGLFYSSVAIAVASTVGAIAACSLSVFDSRVYRGD